MINPLTNLITSALDSDMPYQVIDLVYRLLTALGFLCEAPSPTELASTNSARQGARFKITRWGFLIDELVRSLVDLCDAYGILKMEGFRRDAEREAKLAYLIMCGENVTWDDAYGRRERA